MDLILTNPAGLWALLGIPAVLAIHLLQRQPRPVLSSTLFLLDRTRNESRAGQRIERLRASIPLWLQLLLVLLITWLLIGPRWQRHQSLQRTAIVLDSSASMQAFKPQLLTKLPEIIAQLASHAEKQEIIVLDSALHLKPLYRGSDTSAFIERLASWQPLQGAHDFTPALEVAHSLVGRTGTILLVSDHAIEDLPFNAQLLAIGKKTANVGFTGIRLVTEQKSSQLTWRALVKNYSDTPQQRQWRIQIKDQSQPPQSLTLPAGQTLTLSGNFPTNTDQFTLVLSSDAFPLDDQLPVIRPVAKKLTFRSSSNPDLNEILDPVLKSLTNLSSESATSPSQPDLIFARYDPLSPATPNSVAIIAVEDPLGTGKALQGEIVASPHPLTAGLMWHGLFARTTLQVALRDSDDVLVWQGERPLIFLRQVEDASQLIFNFDLTASNITRIPAFIVMLSRFVEQIRAAKVAPVQILAETNQRLTVATDATLSTPLTLRWQSEFGEGSKIIPSYPAKITTFRAPQAPGSFQLTQGNATTPLMKGVSFFADTREADFGQSRTIDSLATLTPSLIQQHTRSDPYWRIWVALAGLVLLINWHFISRPTS